MKKFAALMMSLLMASCTAYAASGVDYSKTENWAVLEQNVEKPVDVFYIAPTIGLPSNIDNLDITDTEKRSKLLGTVKMVRGVYEDTGRIYSPYYRQAGLGAYYLEGNDKKVRFDLAYKDIAKSFKYYLKHYNNNRPIIVAGFSQGSQHAIRLLKKYTPKAHFRKQFVAGYAIAWRITDDDLKHNKYLKPAQGEVDTGVVLTFNSEAPEIEETLFVANNGKSYCINPLNWRTDNTPAGRDLHLGACFTDLEGRIFKKVPNLTGAYIDDKRGVLKLKDIDPKEYPGGYFADGIYHRYEYNFFYNNLKQNVSKRTSQFLAQNK